MGKSTRWIPVGSSGCTQAQVFFVYPWPLHKFLGEIFVYVQILHDLTLKYNIKYRNRLHSSVRQSSWILQEYNNHFRCLLTEIFGRSLPPQPHNPSRRSDTMVSLVFLSMTSSIRKNEYIKVSATIYLLSNRKARLNILANSPGVEEWSKYSKNVEK